MRRGKEILLFQIDTSASTTNNQMPAFVGLSDAICYYTVSTSKDQIPEIISISYSYYIKPTYLIFANHNFEKNPTKEKYVSKLVKLR